MMKYWRKQVSWLINYQYIFTFFYNLIVRFHLLTGGTVLFILLFSSCNKDKDALGLSVLPEEDFLHALSTDTFSLTTTTSVIDSIPSDEFADLYNVLGSYVDPIFGQTVAGFYCQFKPSTSNVDFGDVNDIVVDSVVFSMVYVDSYGAFDEQHFSVFELAESFDSSSTKFYYSNEHIPTVPVDIINQTNYTPNFSGSEPADGEDPEHLRIRLTTQFGLNLINFTSQSTETSSFLQEFKGIYVTPESGFITTQSSGNGGIFSFNLLHDFSGVTVYYHHTSDNTPSNYKFVIDSEMERFSSFSHNISGYPIELAVNDSSIGEQLLYVQPLSGFATDIHINHLYSLVNNQTVSINKAEILLTLDKSDITDYPANLLLALRVKSETGSYIRTRDEALEGIDHIGGGIESGTTYSFNITRDVQFILDQYQKGQDLNLGYRVLPSSPSSTLQRSIFKGSLANEGAVKLIVSYTPVK